jgi:PAS domain S-box-containing protein
MDESKLNIIDELPVGVIVFDENLNVTYTNETVKFFPQILNLKYEKQRGQLFDLLPNNPLLKENVLALKSRGPFEQQLLESEKINGAPFAYIVKGVALEKAGEFTGGILILEDLAVLEKASRLEIIKTELFEKLLRGAGIEFSLANRAGEILYAPKNFDDKLRDALSENFEQFLKGENIFTSDKKIFSALPVQITELPGSETLYFLAIRDVTEEIEEQEKKGKELTNLRKILAETQSLFFYDGKGNLTNSAVAKSARDIFPRTKNVKIFEIVNGVNKDNFFEEGDSFYFSVKSERGENFFKAVVLRTDDGFVLSATDISARIDNLPALTDIVENFELFLRHSDNFIWTAKRENKKFERTYYTPNAKRIIGYTPKELIETELLWFKIIHPNDRRNVVKILNEAIKKRKDDFVEVEYRAVKKDHTLIWVNEKIQIIRDASGKAHELIGSVSDITKTKEREEKILVENEKLREINQAKDRFISIISHDMRSPFSSILGFTKLLLEQETPQEKTREYISYIQSSAESMLNLVNALLEWTRLQTGRIKYSPKKTRLSEIVRSSVQMLLGSAIQKGVEIRTDVESDIFVHGDKNLLSQVFNNLIGNAIKFTKAGDEIIISAKKENDKFVEVRVKDTGTGIKKEDLGKLFKVDEKFTNPGTAGEKGTGLGLSLVYEIVKKHGGDIRVESQYGKGTAFIFTLPVSSSVTLLVDKNPAELVLYSKLVKSLFPEFKIETAMRKAEIEKVIKEKAPMLMITEIETEDYNIYDFAKELSEKENAIAPRIIVLSHNLDKTAEKRLAEFGITKAFSKPVDLSKFRAAISEILK